MSNRSSLTIHTRGLIVLALAATTLELLALPSARARDARTTDFEALYAPDQRPAVAIPRSPLGEPTCDAVDYDQSCGTATGGPSGGVSGRS